MCCSRPLRWQSCWRSSRRAPSAARRVRCAFRARAAPTDCSRDTRPQIGKDILPALLREGGSPRAVVEAQGLLQISDTSELELLVQQIVDQNPKQARAAVSRRRCRLPLTGARARQAEDFRNGRDKIKGFFVGQIMKSSGGRANPALVEQLLLARLRAPVS